MKLRKLYRLAQRYRFTGGLVFIGLLGLVVWGITRLPKAEPLPAAVSVSPSPQRFDSQILIKEASLSGKLLEEKDQTLLMFDPVTQKAEPLATGVAFRSPQRLTDGRLAALAQISDGGKTSWQVYIQKQDRFEIIPLPILTARIEPYVSAVPLLDPNGQYAVYLDMRTQTGQTTARPAVIRYSLVDLQEEVLTKPAVLAANQVFLSANGQWIGFSYQKVVNQTLDKEQGVGLIPALNKTVNLFPQINLSDQMVSFSPDNQYILFNANAGLSVFSFEEAKVVERLAKRQLVTILADGMIGAGTKPQAVTTLLKSCSKATKVQGFEQIEWYQMGDKGLKKVGETGGKNKGRTKETLVFSAQPITRHPASQWLTGVYTNSNCEGEWGVWDVRKGTLMKLDLSSSIGLMWVE